LVVNEYWSVAGDHIVRVDVSDGEVVHGLGAGVAVHSDDVHRLMLGADELVSADESAGVDPLACCAVPKGVMCGGVQDRGGTADATGSCSEYPGESRCGWAGYGDVGEIGVEVEVQLGDRFRGGLAGGRVGGGHLIADCDV